MARIRTIKPEFWSDERLSELPEATHMLAAAILNFADDDGYFNANPSLIKAGCFPLREPSVSIHDSLTALANIGFLRLGTGSDRRRYGHIVSFKKHQRINRATESRIRVLDITWDYSVSPHVVLSESSLLEQGTGNREQGNKGTGNKEPQERETKEIPDPNFDNRVEAFWPEVEAEHRKANPTGRPPALDIHRKRLMSAALNQFDKSRILTAWKWVLTSPDFLATSIRTGGKGINSLLDPEKILSCIEAAEDPARWKAQSRAGPVEADPIEQYFATSASKGKP